MRVSLGLKYKTSVPVGSYQETGKLLVLAESKPKYPIAGVHYDVTTFERGRHSGGSGEWNGIGGLNRRLNVVG